MSKIYARRNIGINGLAENRAEDHIGEEWFRGIIDTNLYDRIDGFKYERVLDKPSQLKGTETSLCLLLK